jgi:hypothetical protein
MADCYAHPGRPATRVPWWPFTHFLDVDCGHCDECTHQYNDPDDPKMIEIGSEEYWEYERDMREGAWQDGMWVS